MNQLSDTLRYIESKEFFARCAIANDVYQLVKIFDKDPKLEIPVASIDVVAGRIQHLLKAQYDRIYANPYDTAIAAYLWILKKAINGGEYPCRFHSDAADREGLFWARRVDALPYEVDWDRNRNEE